MLVLHNCVLLGYFLIVNKYGYVIYFQESTFETVEREKKDGGHVLRCPNHVKQLTPIGKTRIA